MTENGCDAYLFEGPRSTPELSFAVRHTKSQAGINITASHNPPEYNGYKVYFEDGGQVVEPYASGIIAESQCGRKRRLHTGACFRARKGDSDGLRDRRSVHETS